MAACKSIATIVEGVCFAGSRCTCSATHLPARGVNYYDTHCHLDRLRKSHRVGMADFQLPEQFTAAITNFIDPHLYEMIPDLLDHPKVYGTVGVHPQHAHKMNDGIKKQVLRLLKHPKVIAIGETGLDLKHLDHTTGEEQKACFQWHLDQARTLRKTLVLHCRDAHNAMLEMAQNSLEKEHKIHLHCFCGDVKQAKEWVDSFPNLKIGLTNLISNPSVEDLRHAATRIPLQHLLLETDAPYMTPRNVKYPHKFSHPGLALNVAAVIAKLKQVPLIEVITTTCANAQFIYGI